MPIPLKLAAPSLHNRGKFQFNLHFQAFGSQEFPFIDAVKLSQEWVYGGTDTFTSNSWVSPQNMDSNGYPTTIQTGGYFTVTAIPPTTASGTNTAKTGQYVIRWTGTGTIWVSNEPDQTGTNGRYVFTPPSSTVMQTLNFGVRSMDAVDYIKNISIYALSDEPAYLAGEIWHPDFIARMNEARPGVLRFMNWMASNTCSTTNWASRKPVGYFSQAAGYAKASAFKGTATLSGQNYTLNTGDSLTDKMYYHFQYGGSNTFISRNVTLTGNTVNDTSHPFSNGDVVALLPRDGSTPSDTRWGGETLYVINSATNSYQLSLTSGGSAANLGTPHANGVKIERLPTLSIDNGTTRIPIKNEYGDPLGTNLRADDGAETPHVIWATAIYDDTLKCWLNLGVTNNISAFLNNGTAPELLLDLAIKLKTHPWFNIPFLACDPMTDYTTQLATYMKNNAPAWMVPRYEGPNEHWNFAGGFYHTRYGWNIAFKNWGIYFGTHDWQAKLTSTIAQDIYAVYGNPILNGDKYWMINGFQTASLGTVGGVPVERLRGSTYVNQAAAAQSGYIKIAPHYLSTHTCVANYFTPSAYRTGSSYTGSITSNVLTTTARLSDGSNVPQIGDKLFYTGVSGTVTITGINSFDSSTLLGSYTVSATSNISSQTIVIGSDSTEYVMAYKYAQGDTSQIPLFLATAGGAADGVFNLAQNKVYWNNLISHHTTYRNKDGYAQRITAYEGGYSPDETGTAQVNSFRAASKNHVDCGKLICGGTLTDSSVVTGSFPDFVSVGGEYPSQYLYGGRNVWAALDPNPYVTPDPPIWNGIKTFNV